MISALKTNVFARRKRAAAPESEASRLLTLEQLQTRFPDAKQSHRDSIFETQESTMTSPERVLALCEAIEYVVAAGISGAIVECGVWRGGSSAAAARTLLACGETDRPLWLYDTFTGMTQPTEFDKDFLGRDAKSMLSDADPNDGQSIWCQSGLDEVKRTMAATGYPNQCVKFIAGPVESTLLTEVPESIALLRLDTDWYESTKCELETLFPRLQPGGILIIDDYGHWDGCRRAVDEYFSDNGIRMFLNRIDYTGRSGIKQN